MCSGPLSLSTAQASASATVVAALEEEDELEDLPEADKEGDPLRFASILRSADGLVYKGVVEDFEWDKLALERLYRIKYEDGDNEHLTAEQVEDCQALQLKMKKVRGLTSCSS